MAKNRKAKLKVQFRGVGHGTVDSVRIGVNVPVGQITPDEMFALVVGAQLKAGLAIDPNAKSDAEGQAVMEHGQPGVDPFDLIADVSRYGVDKENFSLSLLLTGDTDLTRLDQFAFEYGVLTLERTGDAGPEVGAE